MDTESCIAAAFNGPADVAAVMSAAREARAEVMHAALTKVAFPFKRLVALIRPNKRPLAVAWVSRRA